MPSEGYEGIWGWADGCGSLQLVLANAANVIVGGNPPYSLTDFFSLYPKFGGVPTVVTGITDGATGTVTGVSSTAGLLAGQYVTGYGIQPGTVIQSAGNGTVVLSLPTTAAGNPVVLTIFTNPILPTAVINAYLYLASNSIFQARWGEMWQIAMALFIAHYCTLWLQGEASTPNSTAGQVASSGLAQGIETSASAGDVSYSVQPVSIDNGGAFNLTLYGQELLTWAQVVGMGNMLFV